VKTGRTMAEIVSENAEALNPDNATSGGTAGQPIMMAGNNNYNDPSNAQAKQSASATPLNNHIQSEDAEPVVMS